MLPPKLTQEQVDTNIERLSKHGFHLKHNAMENNRLQYKMDSLTRVEVSPEKFMIRLHRDRLGMVLSDAEVELIAKYYIIMQGNKSKIKLEV